MSSRHQRQQALIGGIITRHAASRILPIVEESCFDLTLDRDIFRAAISLSKIGLDKGVEYISRVSQTVFFEDGQNAYLVKLIEAFEREAEERGDGSELEDLARDVAAEAKERKSS